MEQYGKAGHKPEQSVAHMLTALHDFVGDWQVTQKIWSTPEAPPVIHRGKSKCTAILGGAATLMITEMETSNFKGVALITYNPKESRYDMAWMDSISEEGIALMHGQQQQQRSRESLRAEFGKMATQQREWLAGGGESISAARLSEGADAVAACLPEDVIASVSTLVNPASEGPGSGAASFRIVENKISDNHWVLDFFVGGAGGEFLVQQNSFSRAGQ